MEYDDIIWVSAYVHGSCLKIKVRRILTGRSCRQKLRRKRRWILWQKRTGSFRRSLHEKGIPLVREGSEVKKGEILVEWKCGSKE